MQGKLDNHPLMDSYKQMMGNKSPEQKADTLINIAKSRGVDINQKIFNINDLRVLFDRNNIPQR